MAKVYQNISELMIDLELYIATQNRSGGYNLAQFPALAKTRYPWIVDNWVSLYPQFKDYANGDDALESALNDFSSSVQGYKVAVTNPINALELTDKFALYAPFVSLIMLTEIGLDPAEGSVVSNELQRVMKLSSEDFKSMLVFLKTTMTALANEIGLGDADAQAALGTPSTPRIKAPTVADLDNIDSYLELSKYVESIILSLKSISDKPPNLLAAANANISGGNVSINDTYMSSVAVPFEISLEHMAEVFLGSKSMFYELVTTNNLQPPYVDEVGKKYPLIAPGSLNNVTISSEQRNNLHAGAKVGIGSTRAKEEMRYVNRITYNSDNTMVLYLSGNQDLNKLQKTDAAFVRIYAPHTVNTGSFINIPVTVVSSSPSSLTPQSDTLRRLDASLLGFGVDIAQDYSTGDMLVGPNGNFVMAYGIKNVRQSVINAIRTVRGELPWHPEYGLDVSLGEKMFGPSDKAAIVSKMVADSILRDPRISSATVKNLTFTGNSVSMLIEVMIQGSSEIIPLSYVT